MSVNEGPTPSVWVTKCSKLLRPSSTVLDLACGSGRHAHYLASRGHDVTALDKSPEALSKISSSIGIHTYEFDLEVGAWPFSERKFDAIVVTNYLYRPIHPKYSQYAFPIGYFDIRNFYGW